jgi:hypothetical protein
MPTFVRAVAGTLLSMMITSAHADNMLSLTSGTDDNVAFILQSPNQTATMVFGNINTATSNSSASANVLNQGSVLSGFPLTPSGNGQNFFTLSAINGQHISSVSFTSTVGLDDVSQIRLGTLAAASGPILGAGLPGLLAACVGLLVLARRRRRLAI